MKQSLVFKAKQIGFAPITGAWIETLAKGDYPPYRRSHPSRVRGLKLSKLQDKLVREFAPITGAWIETILSFSVSVAKVFAPITGAWIETRK